MTRGRFCMVLAGVALSTSACLIEPNPEFIEPDTATGDDDNGETGSNFECPEGTLDCDGEPGCETDSSDPLTCGSCDKRCAAAGETIACVDGQCTGTFMFTDLPDTYVDRDTPDLVFGADSELRVDNRRDAYIALPDLSEIPGAASFETVTLLLSCSQDGGLVEIVRIESPWNEANLSGNNAPSINGEILTSFDAELGENVIDLLDLLPAWRSGDPKHSLALRSMLEPGPSQPSLSFSSSEGDAGPIVLVSVSW